MSGELRRKAIKTTDRRVRMMNEILTCMKLIKVFFLAALFLQSSSSYLLSAQQLHLLP